MQLGSVMDRVESVATVECVLCGIDIAIPRRLKMRILLGRRDGDGKIILLSSI